MNNHRDFKHFYTIILLYMTRIYKIYIYLCIILLIQKIVKDRSVVEKIYRNGGGV